MNLDLFELRDESAPPFDLDFLREIGFRFGKDWDGELLIEAPDAIDVSLLSALVQRYVEGIKSALACVWAAQ